MSHSIALLGCGRMGTAMAEGWLRADPKPDISVFAPRPTPRVAEWTDAGAIRLNPEHAPADILVFPDLNSANISYKLLSQLSDCTPIGPVIAPLDFAANIVQRTSTVEEIINMSHLTALISDIQKKELK